MQFVIFIGFTYCNTGTEFFIIVQQLLVIKVQLGGLYLPLYIVVIKYGNVYRNAVIKAIVLAK